MDLPCHLDSVPREPLEWRLRLNHKASFVEGRGVGVPPWMARKRCFRGHLHIIAAKVQQKAIESCFFNPCNEVEKGWVIVPGGHGERVETSCRNTHRYQCRPQQLHAPPNPAAKQRLDPHCNMMVEMVTC